MIAYPLIAVVAAMVPLGTSAPHTTSAPVHVRPAHRALSPMEWRRAPYSSGVIQAHLFHAGLLHPSAATRRVASRNLLVVVPGLTCTGSPCVFTPVQASEGGQPVNEDPISISPKSGSLLLTGGNDYNCGSSLRGRYLSPDGGTTWNRSCDGLPPGSGGGDGDPSVAWIGKTAYFGGIDSSPSGPLEVAVGSSSDNGLTWSTPVVAVPAYYAGGFGTDKEWMEVDTHKGSPYKKNIYISVTQFASNNNTQITVSHSKDGGKTWSSPIPVGPEAVFPDLHQFTDLATAADGTVYVTYQDCVADGPAGDCGGTQATMYIAKSTDGGKTWSNPVVVDTPMLVPDACGCAFYGSLPNTDERVANIPVVAVDSSKKGTGNIYVIDYNWTGSQMVVRVLTSSDGGNTWSKPNNVAGKHPVNDEFFPWINVSHRGIVGASWLDRRNDPSNINYEAFGAYSLKGRNFSTNLDLSAKPSNPFNDGFGGGFMGDYTGNAWTGKSLYVSWMDTSNGTDAQDDVGGFQL